MGYIQLLTAVVILSQQCAAQYELSILLLEFNAGQGFLANGSRCDPFWFDNVRCSIDLKICIEQLDGTNDDDVKSCKGKDVNLGSVTDSSNNIKFSPDGKAGEWTNPMVISVTDKVIYPGFQLKVSATHKTLLIDEFVHKFDSNGRKIHDFESFSHQRDKAPEPVLLHVAWRATGNTSVFDPTTTPTPTGKPLPLDCDDLVGIETSGVKSIYINGVKTDVYCDIGASNAYTVIQSRGNGSSHSFDQLTFENYKTVYGEPGWDTNFWMGLDAMHSLIGGSGKYGLSVQLCCGQVPARTTFYSNLTMAGEDGKYVLGGNSILDIGMGPIGAGEDLNSPFSTIAKWNLGLPSKFCNVINQGDAVVNGTGGWWFGSCANNLNGHYYDTILNEDVFMNVSSCLLDRTKLAKFGSGIEMRTTIEFEDTVFDAISYSKVRMALYNAQKGAPGGLSDFCSDTAPTSPPTTTTTTAATTTLGT